MDQLLQEMKFAVCQLGDILISEGSPEERFKMFEEVFGHLQDHGIRLNPAECIFFHPGLAFLGHWIDQHSIRSLPHSP